jgi:subtilisin family serine protease
MFARSPLRQAKLRHRWSVIPAIICLFVFPLQAAVHEIAPRKGVERELIVRFKPGARAADRNTALKNAARVENIAGGPRAFRAANASATQPQRIEVREGVKVASELARLQGNPAVEYVEPNYPIQLTAATNAKGVFPNDFEFSKLYGLNNAGGVNAKTNADVKAPAAWAFTTGDKKVVVAVIDTGIDYLHEDLKENLWENPGEIPFNGIDDDGNGFVDDFYGYDFVSSDSDPFDDNEHGTHVAGTIGAKGNNGIGSVGVCWDVSLMALKAFDEQGNGSVAEAIEAIHYAVENGARIINASWGLDERSRALDEAAQFAAQAGVLIVAAGGNNGWEAPFYPASFDTVLAVGASDARDARALFSNYGPYVDVAAPGVNIFSTLPENRYGFQSGTSMAAPHVSGAAALVLARFPNYTRQELFDILVNSVEGVLFDQPQGRGRLDISQAVQVDQPLPTARLSLPANVSGIVDVSGTALGSFFTGYTVKVGAGRTPTNWIEIASSNSRVTNGFLARLDSALVPDGLAVVQLAVQNQNGSQAVAQAPIRTFNGIITYPLSGDILGPGRYAVRGTVHGAGNTYEILYGAGLLPTSWTRVSSGGSGLVDAVLGEWDTSELPTGHYQLRLVVSNGERRTEFNAPAIYIDRNLRAGWPVYVPTDSDFPLTEWRNLRPADLDGDGKMELVLVDAGTRNRKQQITVYNLNGTLAWARELGFDIPPDAPAIGDIDGDGKKEIFVDSTNGIVAFHHDGTPVKGWPVQTAARNHAKVLADLDHDGHLELIAYSQEYAATQVAEMRQLTIYRANGEVLRTWQMAWCGFTNDVQKIYPAVANLDTNADLEIVVPSGCSELVAFDHDRAEAKWRAAVTGELLSSPVIGDVDGDGSMDVIAAVSAAGEHEPAGVYVFNSDGQRWRGWPVLEEYSFISAPVLGDLDRDGRLEIVLVNNSVSASAHVLQWDGFDADGWPVKLPTKTNSRVGVTLGDVNADGRPDVLLTAPGYPGLALSQRDPDYLGGITARDISGSIIPLNNPGAFATIPFESSSHPRFHKGTPLVLEDLDGNGRLDLVFSSIQDRTFGSLTKVKDRSSLYLWELETSASGLEWPMFGHDIANSGAYLLPHAPAPTPTNITRAIRDRVIVGEDRETRIEVLVNDWNSTAAPLELVSLTQPTNGTVRMDGDSLVYLPSTNYSGMDEFTYTMRDGNGLSSEARVFLRVKPINDRPLAEDIDLTVRRNKSVDLTYLGTDPEGDPLSYRIVIAPQHGELWNYPSIGTYYPHKGYSGPDMFTYVANDGQSDSVAATVTVTVLNTNNAPEAISQNLLTKTNRTLVVTPRASDADDDPLTYELVGGATNGTVVFETNRFRFIPRPDFVGEGSFAFRAHDGIAYSEAASVSIGIIATNAAPRASDGSGKAQPNSETKLSLSASDPDGDKIQLVVVIPPLHGTLSGTLPEVSYLPAMNYVGPDRFEFKVTDGFDESEIGRFDLLVIRENRPPVSQDQEVGAEVGRPELVQLNASDPDGDPVRTVILKGPSQGLIYGTGTNLTYVSRPGSSGWDVFTYKLWDGQKFGNPGRVTMLISAPGETRPTAFKSIVRKNGLTALTIELARGKAVTVETSTNLVDWTLLAGPLTSIDGTVQLSDTNAPGERKFYRAIAP